MDIPHLLFSKVGNTVAEGGVEEGSVGKTAVGSVAKDTPVTRGGVTPGVAGVKLIGANVGRLLFEEIGAVVAGPLMIGANVDPVMTLGAKEKKNSGATVVVRNLGDGQQTIMSKPSYPQIEFCR